MVYGSCIIPFASHQKEKLVLAYVFSVPPILCRNREVCRIHRSLPLSLGGPSEYRAAS